MITAKRPGDILLAGEVNEIVARLGGLDRALRARPDLVIPGVAEPAHCCWAVNTSEYDLPQFSVAGIAGHMIADDYSASPAHVERVRFERLLKVRRAELEDTGRFVICADTIPANTGVGRVYVSGVAPVMLKNASDDSTYWADVDAEELHLIGGWGSAQVLWEDPRAEREEVHLAVVRFPFCRMLDAWSEDELGIEADAPGSYSTPWSAIGLMRDEVFTARPLRLDGLGLWFPPELECTGEASAAAQTELSVTFSVTIELADAAEASLLESAAYVFSSSGNGESHTAGHYVPPPKQGYAPDVWTGLAAKARLKAVIGGVGDTFAAAVNLGNLLGWFR